MVAREDRPAAVHPIDALFRQEHLPSDWTDETRAVPVSATPATPPENVGRVVSTNAGRSPARWLWLAPLLLALGCLWQGLPGSARRDVAALTEPPTAVAGIVANRPLEVRSVSTPRLLTRRIDEIRPGMRVLAEHPDAAENAKPDVDIHPPHWRMVSFVLAKPDGSSLEVQSLRPAAWLRARTAGVGDTVFFDLPEMGVQGAATVTEIADCPRIESGPGRIVTSTFRHTAGDVLDLSLSGSGQHPADRIGTTANHPFWSEDRQAFTPAGELAIGEQVRRADGTVTTIASLAARGKRLTVFNLEVDAEHVYHVGVGGVLVHNTYHGNSVLRAYPRMPAARKAIKAQAMWSMAK